MYLVFTRTPDESYRPKFLLLCLCDLYGALFNSLACLILHRRSGFRSLLDCNFVSVQTILVSSVCADVNICERL